MTLLSKQVCNFTLQLRQSGRRRHNCQSEVTDREDECEAERRRRQKKSCRLCFGLIPVALKLMTAAFRKCLCVNMLNCVTLNSRFLFRMKDRCGSQPASLNQVPERRRPLKAHQSESYLPLGRSHEKIKEWTIYWATEMRLKSNLDNKKIASGSISHCCCFWTNITGEVLLFSVLVISRSQTSVSAGS